eukprot:SAG11_NODE_3056_length_2724_cov_4.133333_6_plen_116_part_00
MLKRHVGGEITRRSFYMIVGRNILFEKTPLASLNQNTASLKSVDESECESDDFGGGWKWASRRVLLHPLRLQLTRANEHGLAITLDGRIAMSYVVLVLNIDSTKFEISNELGASI